jgi:hypothetical protein
VFGKLLDASKRCVHVSEVGGEHWR